MEGLLDAVESETTGETTTTTYEHNNEKEPPKKPEYAWNQCVGVTAAVVIVVLLAVSSYMAGTMAACNATVS